MLQLAHYTVIGTKKEIDSFVVYIKAFYSNEAIVEKAFNYSSDAVVEEEFKNEIWVIFKPRISFYHSGCDKCLPLHYYTPHICNAKQLQKLIEEFRALKL